MHKIPNGEENMKKSQKFRAKKKEIHKKRHKNNTKCLNEVPTFCQQIKQGLYFT